MYFYIFILDPMELQHGGMESLFIAGGMIGMFYAAYLHSGYPLSYLNLALCGAVLDLIFRVLNVFPSLKGYYRHMNFFWSAVWGAIPMVLPFFIYNHMSNKSF